MPRYSFYLTAVCQVIVTADNEEQAGLLAANDTPISAYSFETGECEGVIAEDELERYARHADHVIE
ncbi:hypothetical protein SAMN03159444_00124 [Pseudomonas sp. NFACC02]|uniref:hypothetical protein n=1 Tax=Pseudomonas sp. NFACC02 TaxID=1566250 RepID=UPI0008CA94B1|nr:hypothetical protein [Pseudomonas sp. NFACC02]SEP58290.1 hypothetical protein SAMN03159444_00124 [Pseudomonas sp. NFACC02]